MIVIYVSGKPAPQGSKTRNRHGAVYESSNAVGPWREAVRTETQRVVRAIAQPAAEPYTGGEAVEVSILVRLARPAGHYGSGRNAANLRAAAPMRPATTPDIDKLARAILDGITAGGAISDDKQIADLRISKVYCDPGEAPGCAIRIELAAIVPAAERRLFDAHAPGWDGDFAGNPAGYPAETNPYVTMGSPAMRLERRDSLARSAELLRTINGG